MGKPATFSLYEEEDFDTVDLNVSGADEMKKLAELADEQEAKQDGLEVKDDAVETTPEGQEASAKPVEEPVTGQQEASPTQEVDKGADAQVNAGDTSAEADVPAGTPEGGKPEAVDPMEQVRVDRDALQARLDELQVSSLADRQRLQQLEQKLAAPPPEAKPKEPEGPTPEQIVQQLDQRITALDQALVTAEKDKPEDAPGIRAQLRQVERYYNDFMAQQRVAQAKGPDPRELVNEAVKESETQLTFNDTKATVTGQYPMLDANSEYFDEGMRDQVHEIYNPMIQAGMDPSQALAKASVIVMRANGVMSMDEYEAYTKEQETAKQKTDAEAAIASAKAVEDSKKSAAQTGEERKQEAVRRNVDASKTSPPPLGNVGESNKPAGPLDKYNFADMSVEEMMKISSEEEERIERALELYNG